VVYPLDPASGPVGAVCGVSHPPTPVVSFGVSYYGSNPHAPDENIRLEDFLRGVKYFGRIIHRLAHAEEDEELRRDRDALVQLNK
jgi:acetylornithine deacetylase/succinyl-diaminopimelate desuccinylase-like protein